ncbi:MAG: Rab family GTPase [Candidatus Hermodarchaeota archaeon]
MGLLKKWRRKRKVRKIPSELIFESLFETLKTFNEDMLGSISISIKEYPKQKKVPITKKEIKKKSKIIKESIYRPYYFSGYDVTYKIVLFGDPSEERTILAQKFLTNLFKSDSRLSIGVEFEIKSLEVENRRIKLQIWDFEGEERFMFLLPTYVRGANGALFFYNVANYNSLAHIDDWLEILKKGIRQDYIFPIVVAGIVPESGEEREISGEEGIKIAQSRGADGFVECSPRTGENVEETFEGLTRLMMQRSNLI